VNAVAATTNSDPGFLAGSQSSSAPVPAQGGFVNLINALLGPQEPAPADNTTAAAGSQAAAGDSVTVRSSAEIADALIRSMLGSAVTASNLYSDRTPSTAKTEKDREPAQNAQANAAQVGIVSVVAPPASMMPAGIVPAATTTNAGQTLTLQSLLQGGPTAFKKSATLSTATTLANNAGLSAGDAKSTAPKADLAFALRLTTVETPAEGTAAAAPPQEAASAVTAMPIQNQIAPANENSPAPQDPPAQAKDSTKPNMPFAFPGETKQRQESEPDAEGVPAVAASSSASGEFARPLPNPAPAPPVPAPSALHNVEQPQAEPVRSAEQALRTSEISTPEGSVVKTPAQQIAVRIAGPGSSSVDLQVTERAGQMHVSVRTADTGMQTSLRQDLGTLVNSLERSGYRTEALTGRDASSLTAVAAQPGGASFMDARNNGQDAGQNNRGAQQEDRNGSQQNGSRGQSNHSGGGQQQQRRQQYNWIDTLEKTQ
jgi:hypothetical protein